MSLSPRFTTLAENKPEYNKTLKNIDESQCVFDTREFLVNLPDNQLQNR